MNSGPSMLALIEKKKAGDALLPEELEWLCGAFVSGRLPDYQVAAWLMAVCLRGMDGVETLAFTRALVASGQTLEWPRTSPVVDKHSTGGVGDKSTLVLVPLVAAAGVVFAKMSGRGLGHTGGTLDKLESIPGLRVELTLEELRAQVERIGCVVAGQTPELVPADGAFYALRDVTATVDSVPLIASSVMAKKLAAGAPAIVLDVKHGVGAFMASREAARELARTMVAIGRGAGRSVRAVLSPMDAPLGRAVGNALEVREAIAALRGEGPADLWELTLELGSQLMVLAGCTPSHSDAKLALSRLRDAGVAAEKLEQLIAAQGGDPRVVSQPERLPAAPHVETLVSARAGWVRRVQARLVAEAALALGAGRRQKGDPIDPAAGVWLRARVGDRVGAGEALADLHASERALLGPARELLLRAFRISEDPVEPHRAGGYEILES